MCFSTILSRLLHKYFVYMPPTPLSNGPSVNKVLSCLVLSCLVLLIDDNVKFNLHVHAWFDMSRVVFGQFVLLVLLTLLSSE